jgi:hypothetical protein
MNEFCKDDYEELRCHNCHEIMGYVSYFDYDMEYSVTNVCPSCWKLLTSPPSS